MPHLELIFLHSGSADGCNARRVPALSISSDLKIVKAVIGCTNRSPTAADAIEDEAALSALAINVILKAATASHF